MKNAFLIILLIITSFSNAQDADPANGKYLRAVNACTFDFPMFNLSMELPKNTGFKVPFWDTNNAFLELEKENVTYYYDTTEDADNAIFSYSISKEESEDFIVSFYQFSPEEIEIAKTSIDSFTNLPDLKSKLGTFKGLLENDDNVREYYLLKDNLFICFSISATSAKKIKQCEKIIASIQFLDLTEKQHKYLDLVESGYFEEKENTETEAFDDKIDTTAAETTFSFPAFGLKMTYPENWETTIRSTKSAIKKTKNVTEINWTLEDINRQGFLLFDGRSTNMLVMTRILKKPENEQDKIPDFSQGSKILKKFPIIIDDIQTVAKYTGLEEKGNLFFNLTLQSYVVNFSIYDILLDEVPLLESLLSTIHFSEKEKSGLQRASSDIKSLDKQLNLKPYTVKILPVYKLTKPEISNSLPKIQASFKDIGISFSIPNGEDFSYPDDTEIINNTLILKGKAERRYKRISTDLSSKQTITAAIYYFNNNKSFEDYFENSYKNIGQYQTIRKAGFVIVNDKKWGILESTQSDQRRYEFSTIYKDAEFTISLSSQTDWFDPKNKAELENMLFSVRFD